jgi:hypothetical protein
MESLEERSSGVLIGGFQDLIIKPVIGSSLIYFDNHQPQAIDVAYNDVEGKYRAPYPQVLFGYVFENFQDLELESFEQRVVRSKRFSTLVEFYFRKAFPTNLNLLGNSQVMKYVVLEQPKAEDILNDFSLAVPKYHSFPKNSLFHEYSSNSFKKFQPMARFLALPLTDEKRGFVSQAFMPFSELVRLSVTGTVYGSTLRIPSKRR